MRNKIICFFLRIFFSREKVLLMMLLNIIQDTLIRNSDGSVIMMESGMCNYTHLITNKTEDIKLLRNLLYNNAPKDFNRSWNLYFFPPFQYEPRYEFLKELIKKY